MNHSAQPLQVESNFLQNNASILAEKYPNKHLLVQGEEVHGSFDSEDEAIDAGYEKLKNEDPFLVRHVSQIQPPFHFDGTLITADAVG